MEEGRIKQLLQEVQGKSVVSQYEKNEYQNVNSREYRENEHNDTSLLQRDIKSISFTGSTSNNVSSLSFSKTPMTVVRSETSLQSSEASNSLNSSSGYSTPSNVESQEVDRASSRLATNMHLPQQKSLVDTKSQTLIKASKGGQSDSGARGLISQVSKQNNNNNNDKTVTGFTHFPDSASSAQNQHSLTLGNAAEPVVGLFVGTALPPSIQLPSNMAKHGKERSKLSDAVTHSMTNFKYESTTEAPVHSELQGNSSSVLTDHSKKVSEQDKKGSVLSFDSKRTNNSLHEFSNSAPTSVKSSGFRTLPYNNLDSSQKLGHCSPLTVDTTVGSGHLSSSTLSSMSNDHPATKSRKSRSKESKRKSAAERRMSEINDDDEDNDFIPVGMLQLSKKQDTQQVSSVPENVYLPGLQQHFQYTGQLVQQIESQIQELQDQNLQSEMNNKRMVKSGNVTAGYQLQQLAKKLEPNQESPQQLLLQLVQQAQQQQKQLLDQQKQTRQGQQDQPSLAAKGHSLQKIQAVMAPQSHKALAINTAAQSDTSPHTTVGPIQYDIQDARATSSQGSLTQGSLYLQGAQCHSFNSSHFENLEHQQALESNELAVLDKVHPLIVSNLPTKRSEQHQTSIKLEHDPAGHNNMTRQSDKTFFRSITPVMLAGHQNPTLNQQHPEIAKMLSSPVSPRQQISPRQSNSPRHNVSPHPYSDSQSHFASPYPRQTNSPRHSLKQVANALSAAPHQRHIPSPQPNQPRSPHQNVLSWQPISPSQPSPESPSLSIQTLQKPQAAQGQTSFNYMSPEYKTVQNNPSLICRPITVNLGHYKSSAPLEDLRSKQELEQHHAHTQSLTSHLAQRHDSDLMTSPLSIPSHQPPQVFTPGQVIHHRPPELKRAHAKIPRKSRPASAMQSRFPGPLLDMSSNVPVPSVQNASAIWQQMQAKTIKSQFYPEETHSQVDNIQTGSQAGEINEQYNQMLSSSMQSGDGTNSFSQQKFLKGPELSEKETSQSSDSLLFKKSDAPSTATQLKAKLSDTVIISTDKAQTTEPKQLEVVKSQVENVGIKQTPADQSTSQESCTESQLEVHNRSTSSETTSSSEKAVNGLKILSKIASEHYVVDTSGQKESHSMEQKASASDKDKPNESVSEECTVSTDLKNGEHLNHGESYGKHYKMTAADDSLNSTGETPKREVRQRKPKKPFEQEDMPARRNQKTIASNQKNVPASTSQKKQLISPVAVLSHKKTVVTNKPQPKVNVEKSLPEKEKAKKEKDSATTSQHQKHIEGKKQQEKMKVPDEDSETDSKSDNLRRLSQRLLVKEKEKEQKKNESNDDNTRRSQRNSGRIDYKEASDPVDDAGSHKNVRASRRRSPSITPPEEVAEETKDRMTTRSKNRKEEDIADKSSVKKRKEAKSEVSVPIKKLKEDAIVEGPLSQNSPKTDKQGQTPQQEAVQRDGSTALPSEIKNQSKKVVISFKSKEFKKNLPTSSSLTSASETRRMTTRQLVAEVDISNSDGSNNKPKRLAPSEFIDELPPVKKRSRKPAVSGNTTPGKSDQNTELKDLQPLKEQESLEGKERNIVESKTMDTNNKVPVSSNKKVKRRRHHNYRSRSRRRRAFRSAFLKRKATGKDSEGHENEKSLSASVTTATNEEPARDSAENSDVKDESEVKKPQLGKEIFDQQQPSIWASDDPPKSEFQHPFSKSPPASSSSTSMVDLSISLSSSKSITASPQKSDRDSHLKSDTSNLLSGKEGERIQSQINSVSEKRKMVMFRLVPVLGEDISDLEVSESLVPLSGFFVPGGNNDRVLLPQNVVAGFVGSKDLPSPTADSSPGYKRSTVTPQKDQATHQPSWSSEGAHTKSSSHGVASTLQLSTVFSPLRSVQKVNDNPSAWTCEPPSLNQSWPSQLSQSINTPPPSVGEPKKPWTTPQPQPSPSAYGPSPSWNATPPSIMSSSPLSTSSSAWTMSSSSNLPNQSHTSSQAWPATCPQPPLHESSWRSSPSATAAITESWSKEYFPSSGRPTVADNNGPRESMELDMGPGSNGQMGGPVNENYTYESQNQSANLYSSLDQPLNSNLPYETSQDAEFNRPENLIQGLLRHVSNSASADLAAFNLGQQDLAFLENRLRQTLSPNTIFSAVEAYDDNSGPVPSNNQDNSLQDSMSLVHTVNLDMEEANLDSSSQLDLSGLSTHPSSHGTPTTRVPEGLHKPSQDPSYMLSNAGNTPGAPEILPAPDSSAPKEEGKKEEKKIKERKHQYDIVLTEESRKFKCKACGKMFSSSTIYRHLRVHDPDYKIACDLCDKTYTQKQSLEQHKRKCHSEGSVITTANVKGASIDEEPRKEQEPKSHNEAKRQRKSSSSTDLLASSLDENELRKQLETHRQVEELRRMKAEKKAHCKGLNQAGDDPACGLESDIREEESMPVNATLESQEFAVTQYEAGIQEPAKSMDSSNCSPENTSMLPVMPALGQTSGLLHSAPKGHYQLNAPQPVMSTLAPVLKTTAPESGSKPSFTEGETKSNEEFLSPQEAGDNTDPSKFNCTVCNSQLGSKNGYMLHMRRHHKTKSKICSYCGKSFHTGQELKSHVRTHTGEKPYQCEICYVCFAHSGSFVSHKKGHTNRKETEPFPIVNGEIQYPSTFRKPRLAGPKEEGVEKPKKRKKKAKDSALTSRDLSSSTGDISMSPSTMGQSSCPTSVIRKNSLDSLGDQQLSGGRIDPGMPRRLSMNDQLLNPGGGHLYNAGLSEQQMTMSPTPEVQPGETYPTPSSGAASEYYNSYKDTSHQRHFMSPQSSPQDYYSQGKYYPQSSSADQYNTDSTNQVVKSHQYSSNIPEDYSESVPSTGSYFSSQQTYSFDLPGSSNMESGYQQEDYESNLPPYKPDPSSSEIVKKLLQHYNVPASSYQESTPMDYGHQLQGMSDYTGSGCETAPPMYGGMEVSAPPSYSASVQQKQYYGGLAGGSLDYNALQQDSGMLLTQQTHGVRSPENQYTSIHAQPNIQRETYRSDSTSRYSAVPEVYSEGQYNRPSSQQSYTQQTYDMSSAPRETFRQGLPKIESLARDSSHLESGPKSL